MVSGAETAAGDCIRRPGDGKVDPGRLLADLLPLPLVAKDRLREIMADAFDVRTREQSRALLSPGFRIYYQLISELLRAGVGIVAECNFHHGVSEAELAPVASLGSPVVVHCQTDRDLSIRRFVARHEERLRQRRFAFDGDRVADIRAGRTLESWDMAEPVEIGAPILRVDTTDGYAPDLDTIIAFIRVACRPRNGESGS
jgi:hypothetical protein